MMSSTLRKERAPADMSRAQQVAAGAPAQLGSDGSSRESETSSVDTGLHPEFIDVTVVLPDRSTKTINVEYG